MQKIDKRNFNIGAILLILGMFSFSFMPIILKKLDVIFVFNAEQFKDLGTFFCVVALVFWLNCEGYFKKQIALLFLLFLFFITAVGLNEIIIYP